MNLFKKVCAVIMFMAGASVTSNAQFFDHLGAGVGVGTNGISIDVASNISRFVNIRAGVDIMPGVTFNADADYNITAPTGDVIPGTVNLKGDLGRVQGHVIFNVYPIPTCGLYVAAGGYFGGDKLLKITGHADDLAGQSTNGQVVIGDYIIPVDSEGNIKGGLKVNGFRPYLGIGWGRAVPGRLLAFGIDLGVQFEGKPEVYTDYGEISKGVYEDDNTYNKIRNALAVYPTLTFKLNFRAF